MDIEYDGVGCTLGEGYASEVSCWNEPKSPPSTGSYGFLTYDDANCQTSSGGT